jgi:hypothetical protein
VAGETVVKGVEGYPALAFGSDGAGGMGGVLAVDFGAIGGCGRIHKGLHIGFAVGKWGCVVQ